MKVLILLKCREDGKSNYGQFKHPEKGYIEALDWDGKPEWGGGLHGLLWGSGSFDFLGFGNLFQVIEADSENVIEFDDMCKFKCGNVLLTGSQQEAITLLKSHPNYPKNNILNYDIQIDVKFAVAGDESTLKGGDWADLKAGDRSHLKGRNGSLLKGGKMSTLEGGDRSRLEGGIGSLLKGGDMSTLTAGDWSTLEGGIRSVLTGGIRSILTAGEGSTLEGGDRSVLIVYSFNTKGEYVPFVKKITKKTASKKFKVTNGKFNLIK